MPTIRTVFIRLCVTVEKLLCVELLFGSLWIDALFYEDTANNQPAAKKHAENYAHQQPELHVVDFGHKQPFFFICFKCFDEKKRQRVSDARSGGSKYEFYRVCIVTLSERRGYIACHRAVRHLRNRGTGVPQQIHYDYVCGKSAYGHSPMSYGEENEEYTQKQGYTAPKHIRFASAVSSARIVGDKAHKRVGYSVPDFGKHHNGRCQARAYAVEYHIRKHNAIHHTYAAAVHQTAYAVGEFFFERNFVLGAYGIQSHGVFLVLFHVIPRKNLIYPYHISIRAHA